MTHEMKVLIVVYVAMLIIVFVLDRTGAYGK